MIKQVHVKKGKKAWLVPISVWLGVCKDGARDAGYAFPDDCMLPEGTSVDREILSIQIDNWMPVDFKDFLAAYERGDIKLPKAEPIVPKQVQTVAPADPVAAPEPKPKTSRKKK